MKTWRVELTAGGKSLAEVKTDLCIILLFDWSGNQMH